MFSLSVLAALGHLSRRERQERLGRCTVHSMHQKQAQRMLPLCLFAVSCACPFAASLVFVVVRAGDKDAPVVVPSEVVTDVGAALQAAVA